MDRWLLFPVVAATLWAQEAAPAAADAEKALRARVDQFYTLQVQKKFRQAEAFVAEDTKDFYYNSHKSDLLGFSVTKVELLDNNTKAKITVNAKATMMIMGAGRLPFESPAVTLWKIENGAWVWYIDQEEAKQSPFGQMRRADGGPGSEKNGAAGFRKTQPCRHDKGARYRGAPEPGENRPDIHCPDRCRTDANRHDLEWNAGLR